MKEFPCTKCGACCRNVHLSKLTAYLDSGNGVCLYYDIKTSLCKIYKKRPDICNIEKYYKEHFKNTIKWDKFVEINLIACKQLNN